MAYDSGFLSSQIEVKNPGSASIGRHGTLQKGGFVSAGTFWANVTYNRGARSLNSGSVEAYDYYLVRMRYNAAVDSESHIIYDGREFRLDTTPKSDRQRNETQFLMVEIVK